MTGGSLATRTNCESREQKFWQTEPVGHCQDIQTRTSNKTVADVGLLPWMRSQETRRIFRDFDADMDAGSLDEAYLDVTEYCNTHGLTGACRHKD
jgi:hypothetical protein